MLTRCASRLFLLAALLWLGIPSAFALRAPSASVALSPENRVGGSDQFASGRFWSEDVESPENAMGFEGCDYETASGRPKWLNRDPIGEEGGINLYSYVGNDPLNNVDPFGLLDFHWYNPISWFWPGYTGPTYSPPLPLPNPNTFGGLHGIDNDFNGLTGGDVLRKALGDSADAVLNLAMMFPFGAEEAAGKVVCQKFPRLGWRGSKPYRDALNVIRQGGPTVDVGFTPTLEQALQLLKDAGVDLTSPELRIEPIGHAPPNPHIYPHINYPRPSGGKGTIRIQ